MYEYQFEVIRVVDGDSIKAMVDLGMKNYCKKDLRLYGIDAYERYDEGGREATAALKFLTTHSNLWFKCYGQDKFGRWLAEIFDGDDPVSLNHTMMIEGHAIAYHGGKRKTHEEIKAEIKSQAGKRKHKNDANNTNEALQEASEDGETFRGDSTGSNSTDG